MAYCKKCGNYCGDGDSKFCSNCGTPMSEQPAPQKSKPEINKFAKIYLVIALLVVAVVIALFVGKSLAEKDMKEAENTETSQVFSTTQEEKEETEEETEEIVKESVSVSQEIVVVTVPVQPNYYPASNWSWDSSNPEVKNITYDTPSHAGVNLRVSPTDDSAKIVVLPEGTKVIRINAANESSNSKYIRVVALYNGNTYVGYVMQRYVSTFTGASYNSRISYNTPDHLGVVLRAGDSGNSQKIMVVPEGTQVMVVNNVDEGAYWPVKVFYNGEIYSGYVLGEYVEDVR